MAGAIRDTDVFRTYWTASEDLLPATCPPPSLLATDVGSGAFPPSSLPTAPANLFVMIHGAGQGALSYAVTASLLAGQHPNSVVMAMDLRNHGHSRAADPVHAPMSRAQLASDVAAVVCGLYPSLDPALKPAFHDEEVGPKDVVLVGHSLGGAVAAHMAAFEKPPMLQHLLGLVVLDVVEGTAIEALPGMRGIVSARPGVFPSMDAAVQWILETGQVNNASSARVSVPAQLVPVSPSSTRVRWVTDLMATEPFWQDWFAGLSSLFLRAPAAKLLILAGTDRLDRELTIGQMQGKFQMEVLQAVGHNLHEDAPSATAHLLSQFANRNARLVLPPKFNGTRAAPPPAAAATTAAAGASAVRPVSIPKLSAPRSHMSEGGGGDGGDM
ncbi:Alpha/Beta hydrolase protein [Blastocladiella britannica]|nr:Alpha/Beta hydrolase protein [Blastocladiella britannica]